MENNTNRQHYHIWVDGSALNSGQYMGAGWVIVSDKNDQKPVMGHKSIDLPISGNSIIAEAKATELALLSIPNNSLVTLHTDCKMVMDILENKKKMKNKNNNSSKTRKKTLDALSSLFNTIQKQHVFIMPVKTNDTDPNLLMAHNLAQQGATQAKANRAPKLSTPSS